jgi:tetratricopeptide (TPR) repeat protein
MRIALTALLLLLASTTAFAAPASSHWVELRSPHFTVFTESNQKDARRIASQFERMRVVFRVLLPDSNANVGIITVIAVEDNQAMRALEPAAWLAKGQSPEYAYLLSSPDKNYIVLRLDAMDQEHPFASIYHEYTHLVNSKSPWIPLWLNEGEAEFYANTDIGKTEVRYGQPSSTDIVYLRGAKLLPLLTLLAIDSSSPSYHDEDKTSIFYKESWALHHMLRSMDSQNKTHRLRDYSVNLIQGQDSVTAARNAFGNLDTLQQQLESYIKLEKFSLFQISVETPVDESTFIIRTHTAAAIDADAVRADVLAQIGRTDEALELVSRTLRDDPQNPLASEVMGSIQFTKGDVPAALKWYDKAAELNPQDHLDFYYAAILELKQGESNHDPKVEADLRKAIQLEPTFAPAYDALANLYCSRHENLVEAHKLNTRAIELDPGNITYLIDDASIFMVQHENDNALVVLKTAEQLAKTSEQLGLVHAELEKIKASKSQGPRTY